LVLLTDFPSGLIDEILCYVKKIVDALLDYLDGDLDSSYAAQGDSLSSALTNLNLDSVSSNLHSDGGSGECGW